MYLADDTFVHLVRDDSHERLEAQALVLFWLHHKDRDQKLSSNAYKMWRLVFDQVERPFASEWDDCWHLATSWAESFVASELNSHVGPQNAFEWACLLMKEAARRRRVHREAWIRVEYSRRFWTLQHAVYDIAYSGNLERVARLVKELGPNPSSRWIYRSPELKAAFDELMLQLSSGRREARGFLDDERHRSRIPFEEASISYVPHEVLYPREYPIFAEEDTKRSRRYWSEVVIGARSQTVEASVDIKPHDAVLNGGDDRGAVGLGELGPKMKPAVEAWLQHLRLLKGGVNRLPRIDAVRRETGAGKTVVSDAKKLAIELYRREQD